MRTTPLSVFPSLCEIWSERGFLESSVHLFQDKRTNQRLLQVTLQFRRGRNASTLTKGNGHCGKICKRKLVPSVLESLRAQSPYLIRRFINESFRAQKMRNEMVRRDWRGGTVWCGIVWSKIFRLSTQMIRAASVVPFTDLSPSRFGTWVLLQFYANRRYGSRFYWERLTENGASEWFSNSLNLSCAAFCTNLLVNPCETSFLLCKRYKETVGSNEIDMKDWIEILAVLLWMDAVRYHVTKIRETILSKLLSENYSVVPTSWHDTRPNWYSLLAKNLIF